MGKGVAEIFLHSLATDQGPTLQTAITANENIGPNGCPIPGVFFSVSVVLEKFMNEPDLPIRLFLRQEITQLLDRRNAAQNIQIQPATPFAIRRRGRGAQLVVVPNTANLFVDSLHLWAVVIGARAPARERFVFAVRLAPGRCSQD